MKKSEAFPSAYLSVADLQGRAVVVEISNAKEKRIGDENKVVLEFHNQTKGLVLNKTNWNMIEQLLGSEDTDDWTGQKIILQPDKTQYGGKVVDCIRVAPQLPQRRTSAAPQQEQPRQMRAVTQPAPFDDGTDFNPDEYEEAAV